MIAYRTRLYLRALRNAAIASAVIVVPTVIRDPRDFNPFDWHSLLNFCGLLLSAMIAGVALYVSQHPIPDPELDADAEVAAATQVARVTAKTDTMSTQLAQDILEEAAAKDVVAATQRAEDKL